MKVCFMGTPDFAAHILTRLLEQHEVTLVVTQPDRVNGRGGRVTVSDVKAIATEKGIPVFQPERIKRPEAIEELKKYEFDIIVVAAFGQILPPPVLDLPKYGCVNVHASLLPKYRGAAPIQWAIINGDPVTGVTTMQMGPGLDDGDILQQKEVPIAKDETGGSLFDKLAVAGGDLILETLSGLEKGAITPQKQEEEKATHVGMIQKEMGNLDFSKGAAELERLIRGLNPWPSAYSFCEGKMLKIWKAEVVDALSAEKGTANAGAAKSVAGAEATETAANAEAGKSAAGTEATETAANAGAEKSVAGAEATETVANAGAAEDAASAAGNEMDSATNVFAPGTLVRRGDEVLVVTGNGFLKLLEVQLEGKKRMVMSDFLRGHELPAGLLLTGERALSAGEKS